MRVLVTGFLIAGLIIAVGWATIPLEESRNPDLIFITYLKTDERFQEEQSQTPEIILIAQRDSQDQKEEVVLYDDWNNLEERRRFIRLVSAFAGTPYRRGGVTAQGMDCSGFTYMVYRLFGVSLPRTVSKQYLVGKPIERIELEEGDLVFLDGTGKPLHVGIYLGDGKFIHASSAAKQIRTDFLDTPWQFKRFIGAVRVRELRNPRETR